MWRVVVVSKRSKLDYKLGFMVVRNETITRIHLSEISVLILENTAISLTNYLLSELAAKKIKVIFCDEKRNPCSELVSYYGSHDTSMKIKKQIEWSDDFKGIVWSEIVAQKIRKQADTLRYFGIVETASMLDNYIEEIEYKDKSNREGHAAKVYFNALFGMDFTRTAEIPTNAALNYGYGIVLSAINREVCSNGYLTQLGLCHDNMFNQFNFSCDLIEPFRPIVDRRVKEMHPNVFEKEQKYILVDLLNSQVIIDGKQQYLVNAIKIYCRSVFDALNENDISLIKFYRNEVK
jgi:CRISPR-associated endonuclease Cas1 subtype II